jgi:hypothetical protein
VVRSLIYETLDKGNGLRPKHAARQKANDERNDGFNHWKFSLCVDAGVLFGRLEIFPELK